MCCDEIEIIYRTHNFEPTIRRHSALALRKSSCFYSCSCSPTAAPSATPSLAPTPYCLLSIAIFFFSLFVCLFSVSRTQLSLTFVCAAGLNLAVTNLAAAGGIVDTAVMIATFHKKFHVKINVTSKYDFNTNNETK